jgi:hypothetical protein
MKTTSVHAFLWVFAVVTALSCRKEKNAPVSKMEVLTRQAWLYDEYGIDQNRDGIIDNPIGLEACAYDDLITFHNDGSGTLDQGADLCDPGFPQTQSFDWKFYNNETQLEYGGEMHTILTLDETQLSIYTEEDSGGTPVRYMLTYRR